MSNEPRSSDGVKKPWTRTVTMITIIPTKAAVLAFASYYMAPLASVMHTPPRGLIT